jgi:ABC-type nitrate/sulfonate/bicarbonate transport system ATPase subunit
MKRSAHERLSAAPSSGQALRLEGIRHEYETVTGDPVVALDRIDLDVAAGSFVTLVGPSGCGKSTLLQLIAGFIEPSEGSIFAADALVDGPGHDRGVVFQQPTSLLPWRSVRQNVELGPRLRGVPKNVRRDRAHRELERVGLGEFADRAVYELSGGMQQRTQIARVLANDPEVMLMDEPFGALDALTRERLQNELQQIWRSTRPTVLLITHSVEEAVALGTRVIVMSQRPGRIVFDVDAPFAGGSTPLDTIRRDGDFVALCARVRDAIEA